MAFLKKGSERDAAREMLDTLTKNALSQADSESCEGDITIEEVFGTMKNLPREKAMGPDGVPNEFYKTFRKLIAPELTRVFNEAHQTGRLSKSIKKAR